MIIYECVDIDEEDIKGKYEAESFEEAAKIFAIQESPGEAYMANIKVKDTSNNKVKYLKISLTYEPTVDIKSL